MSNTNCCISVPASFVRSCSGLSFDFGSTLCKIIYRSKENLEEAKNKTQPTDLAHLEIVSVIHDEWQQKLDDLKKLAIIDRTEPNPTIKTTGQGCSVHAKLIEEKLAIRLEQKSEFDCFVKGFNFLMETLNRENVLEPFEENCIDDVITACLSQMQAMKSINDLNVIGNETDQKDINEMMASLLQNPIAFIKTISGIKNYAKPSDQPIEKSEQVYPCLVGVCGSGAGFMKISENKTFKFVELTNRGGRALQGLSCLLLSCKSHEEFMDLASRGVAANLDFNASDFYNMIPDTPDEKNMYTVKMENASDLLMFCFGKVVHGKTLADYKKEDVARALLNYFILDFVQTTTLTCHANNLTKVFLTGSFFKDPLARFIFTKEMARKNIVNFFLSTGEKKPIEFSFVKNGGHLGAIGAMII